MGNGGVTVYNVNIDGAPLVLGFLGGNTGICTYSGQDHRVVKSVTGRLRGTKTRLYLNSNCLSGLRISVVFHAPNVDFGLPRLRSTHGGNVTIADRVRIFFSLYPTALFTIAKSSNGAAAAALVTGVLRTRNGGMFINNGVNAPLLPRVRGVADSSFIMIRLSSFRLVSVEGDPSVTIIAGITPGRLSIRGSVRRCVSTGGGVILRRGTFSHAMLGRRGSVAHSFGGCIHNRSLSFDVRAPLGGNT